MERIVKRRIQDWSGQKWESKNFRKQLLCWLRTQLHEDDQEWCEDIASETGGMIPDLFRFENRTVHVLEIEDTSKLTEEKLLQYCWLWNALDTFDIELRVVVTDRYGVNHTELPVMQFYISSTAQQICEKATASSSSMEKRRDKFDATPSE
jgi:hypothetical protein